MAVKVKTWVWVVVAIVAVCILGLIAIAGVSIYYVTQHLDTKPATPAEAAQEFEQVRSRFGAQPPLIELDNRGRVVKSHTNRPAPANVKKPDELHVLAFDAETERIVRLTIPWWLLRFKAGNARIQLGGRDLDLEDLHLSIEDLERFGPTLIVDHKAPDGERVLVWSQ